MKLNAYLHLNMPDYQQEQWEGVPGTHAFKVQCKINHIESDAFCIWCLFVDYLEFITCTIPGVSNPGPIILPGSGVFSQQEAVRAGIFVKYGGQWFSMTWVAYPCIILF